MDRCRGQCEQHRIDLPVLFALWWRDCFVRKSCGTLHLADDRIKRAVRMLRGAKIAQPSVRLSHKAFQHRRRQPRLNMPVSTREQHHFWPSPVFAFDQRAASSSSSSSRSDAFQSRGRRHCLEGFSTMASQCHPGRRGPDMPLRSCAPLSPSSNRLPRSFRVLSAITTLFIATPCKRAAGFGVSPTMPRSLLAEPTRSPTTTSAQ